jgi:hypothetical protein
LPADASWPPQMLAPLYSAFGPNHLSRVPPTGGTIENLRCSFVHATFRTQFSIVRLKAGLWGFSGIQSHHCSGGLLSTVPPFGGTPGSVPFFHPRSAVPIASVQAFPSRLRHILLRRLLEDLFVVVAAEVVVLAFVSRFGRTGGIHIHFAHRTQRMRIGGNLLGSIDVV